MLNIIQQSSRFALIHADNIVLMQLWHINQQSRLRTNHFTLDIKRIEAPQGRHLTLQPEFPVCERIFFRRTNQRLIHTIHTQERFVLINIRSGKLIQDRNIPRMNILIPQHRIILLKIPEKSTDIICIRESRTRLLRRFLRKKILLRKRRKILQNLPKLKNILCITVTMISLSLSRHTPQTP